MAGNIEIASPATDLAGSLAQLPESLLSAWSTLQDQCTVDLEGDLSSFIVVGRGGLPIEPGSWLPSFILRPTPNETDDSK